MTNIISYILKSDGEEFSQAFKVKSIMVLNEANRIPRAQIILLDGNVSEQDFGLSNLDFFKPGRKFEIFLGYENEVTCVFKGLIVKHGIKITDTNASYLEIECKHEAVKLTVTKKNRFFYNMNDNEAISQILNEAGINFSIEGMAEVNHLQLVQYESSSWDFMISRAEANGHLALFDFEKLTIAAPTMGGDEVLDCQYGSNVISFQAGMDCENHFPQVQSKSWSAAGQEIIIANGTARFTNEIGNISSKDLAQVLNQDAYNLQHTASLPEEELTAWASAKATKNELSKIMGHARIVGNSVVYPGKIIRLTGFGDRFSGKAYVTGVRHEVSEGNWTTDIQFGLPAKWFSRQQDINALPAAGILPAANGLLTGVVTQLESDPENEYRIKVRLPIISNEEDGIWARLAKSYAGENYGICFYPEIGDEVVVSFLNDDPRKAVVLGVLHSSAKPSPITPSDDNHEKAITTRSNIKILWNDDKKSVAISTPGGQEIRLDDENKEIKITDTHQNIIQMSSKGITIESAGDLKIKAQKNIAIEGTNISSKAHAKFTAEGGAGAEVKTNAIAVLKGSLVQIN